MSIATYAFSMTARATLLLLFRILYRLKREGTDRIPARGGVLLVANHASFLDPPLLQIACRRLVVFTPRTSLSDHWLYRILTALCALVPVRRGEADLGAARTAVDLLRKGHVVAMFPEQTRSADGRLGPLKPGFHLLARRAGVPVVPVGIQGAFDIWPRQRRRPRLRGRLVVRIGAPLAVADLPRDEALRVVGEALRALAPDADAPTGHTTHCSDGASREGGSEQRETTQPIP